MKSSKALKVVIKRNQYISKILQLSKYKILENEFSQIFDVPSKVLFMENCQMLSRDWNFKEKNLIIFHFLHFSSRRFYTFYYVF